MTNEGLSVYVVYENPLDFPGMFVLRRQVIYRDGTITPDPEPLAIDPDVAVVRRALPEGLFPIPRFPEDDPAILEVHV